MENEIIEISDVKHDLSMARAPQQVLDEALKAAKALQSVITQKAKPVLFNGEQYIEFEDWQVLGRFYGVTARVSQTEQVSIDGVKGFGAKAEAIDAQGRVISAAEAMCLNDEPNWSRKPLFQLRSMAQTRACAKALRNVLAWVVVMAGYRPSVAEEMVGGETVVATPPAPAPKRASEARKVSTADAESIEFVPAEVTVKEGTTKAGKPFKKLGIKSPDGVWFSTFDTGFQGIADEAKAANVAIRVHYKTDGNFKNIVSVEAV